MSNRFPFVGSSMGREPSIKPASLVLDTVRLMETWSARAHQRRALRRLPEHVMHDIAVSQADIEAEAGKPFWRA